MGKTENCYLLSKRLYEYKVNRLYLCFKTDDGWMTCGFTSFSTVFQSYQDDGWVIMKGCVQWNPFYD